MCFVLIGVVLACGNADDPDNVDPNLIYTQVAETVIADLTKEAIPQTQNAEIAPTLTITTESVGASVLLNALTKITNELESNLTEIILNPKSFQYLENPIGEGIFIYDPSTRFFGVERYFIWVYINEEIYVVNGATRSVTPKIPVCDEASPEVWELTNISINPASDLIDFIFEGEELKPSYKKPKSTVTPGPEILFGYTTEERKQIYYEKVEAEDKAWLENKLSANFYHQEVADLYGLTLEQLDQIGLEGTLNNWPMPPIS